MYYFIFVIALSQSKGMDMAVQPRSKKSVIKKLKASTKKGKKITTITQENPLSKGKYHECQDML